MDTDKCIMVVNGRMGSFIEGRFRTVSEIRDDSTPPDDGYAWETPGKHWALYIFYRREGPIYEMYQDGKKFGERQCVPESDTVLGCVQRITKDMKCTTLRRL